MLKKITALMVLVITSSLLFVPFDIDARGGGRGGGGGGRGGGGRGGGGGGRGGGSINRTPSMSRTSSRPSGSYASRGQARPSQGRSQQSRQYAQQRPSSANRGDFRNQAQQRPSSANRSELRSQVSQFAQNRPAQGIDRQALGQREQSFLNNRSNQLIENRQLSDKVSNRLQQTRPDYTHMFDRNFFDRHDIDLDYVGSGSNWWRPAAWATLATWGAWRWSTPYYYDEGGYAYPLSDSSYSYPTTTTEPATAYPYGSVATQPPAQTSQSSAPAEEWLPLGVFAVGNSAEAAAQSNRFIQLAVNRTGEIAGVLYNATTDAAQDLTGTVNHDNQKAYWSLNNQPGAPIASTGIYNLTEDQTPINVHFVDGSDQTWFLVRLKQET